MIVSRNLPYLLTEIRDSLCDSKHRYLASIMLAITKIRLSGEIYAKFPGFEQNLLDDLLKIRLQGYETFLEHQNCLD